MSYEEEEEHDFLQSWLLDSPAMFRKTSLQNQNIFRLTGDFSHFLAVIIIMLGTLKNRSSQGISGRSHLLFLLVWCTRYLDVFTVFISFYVSGVKAFYIITAFVIVFLIYTPFRDEKTLNWDVFKIEFLILASLALAIFFHYSFAPLEVLWAFSIYLESVAILPQLFLSHKTRDFAPTVFNFVLAMTVYRVCYVGNWAVRYHYLGIYDPISTFGGCIQCLVYFYFIYLKCSGAQGKSKLQISISTDQQLSGWKIG